MNNLTEVEQKEISVINIVYVKRSIRKMKVFRYVILWVMIAQGCKTSEITQNEPHLCTDCYKVERYKKHNNIDESTIRFNYYDSNQNNKVIPFTYVFINNLAFKDSVVKIIPMNGKIDVLVSYHLKKSIRIEGLKVSKGDSIIVNCYLKDNNTIFY